ncbi:MAG TPA: alcohol dehydrogenase catalytic domain-containing protein [Actinomycetota bacterium]|nr:alcohol dehydrogenase catalytic domain-containing protein [Actinomycetota bacterium]
MRAVVFAGPGRVAVDDVPAPRVVEPDDVVVGVERTAICGSDLHVVSGKTPGMNPGSVIGHEFVGRVRAAGPAVSGVAEGDLVLGSFLVACGGCAACRRARFNFCERRRALGLGSLTGDLDGAQAEAVRVPAADVNVRRLPDLDEAGQERVLFAGDILATGFYATALADVAPEETVAVIGGGPVGLFCALAARTAGALPVVIDTDPARAAFASERYRLEALAVDAGANAAEAVVEATGDLADVVVEAVGAPAAFKTALKSARDGGRVVVVGVYGAERYDLPMGMVWVRGLQVRFAGMANVQAHWETALAAVERGAFDPAQVITHRMTLDEAEKGYELFAAREAMKVVMTP